MFLGKSRSMLTADFRLRCDKFNRDANIYSTDVSFDRIKRIDFGADRNEYFNISTTALTGYYVKAILRATLLTEMQHHPAGNLCLTTIPIRRRGMKNRYVYGVCLWSVIEEKITEETRWRPFELLLTSASKIVNSASNQFYNKICSE